jgi:cyanophycinase
MNRILGLVVSAVVALPSVSCFAQSDHPYKYFRVGNTADAADAKPRAGYALMGGGTDLDEAFQWLCDRAGGGDFLVLRATGDDDYNPYVRELCPRLNSVATLILPNRAAAEDPFVASTIRQAEAVFIAGGDQANYINFWMKSPVQDALNDDIARGIPLGGTSAGLAVMGEWAYSAQGDKPDDPNLSGKLAMSDPLGPRITLVQGFLRIPILSGIITDTHFARRDRMGRLLVFLARLNEPDGKPVPPTMPRYRGIGVEERAAVLLEPDGSARVIGRGGAYFIDTSMAFGMLADGDFGVMASHRPMTFGPYLVQKVTPGHAFNLKTWTGESTTYQLTVKNGQITSMQHGGVIY